MTKKITTMVSEAIIPDVETVYEVIDEMHKALQNDGIKPCHIALFGSFLRGDNHNESDMIIIISESFEGKDLFERFKMTLNAEKKVRKRYVVPMDILTKTPEEYEKTCLESKIII